MKVKGNEEWWQILFFQVHAGIFLGNPHLVLQRSNGYVVASATEAAATHIRYLASQSGTFHRGVIFECSLFCNRVIGLEDGQLGDVLLCKQLGPCFLRPSHCAIKNASVR